MMLAMIWFRCDMLILLAALGVSWMAFGRATAPQLVVIGAVVGLLAVAATVGVDSPLWRRWLWPEAEVLLANSTTGIQSIYKDQMHEWHWYWTVALPKGMLAFTAFLPLGLLDVYLEPFTAAVPPPMKKGSRGIFSWLSRLRLAGLDWRVCELAFPSLAYIALLSIPKIVETKQPRFIFPVFPLLFITAASGMYKVFLLGFGLLGWEGGAGESAAIGDEPIAVAATLDALSRGKHNYTDGVGLTNSDYNKKKKKGAEISASPAASGAVKRKGKRGASVVEPSTSPKPTRSSNITPSAPPVPLSARFLGLCILSSLPLAFILSSLLTAVYVATNARNYPGGEALQRLYSIVDRDMRRVARADGRMGLSTIFRTQPGGSHFRAPPPACLAGDATGVWGGIEWFRQCLSGACPPSHESPRVLSFATNRTCTLSPSSHGSPIRVHISNLAAQEGVSRFGETWSGAWEFSKREHLRAADFSSLNFDFLISESVNGGGPAYGPIGTEEDTVVMGKPRWSWKKPFTISTEPRLYLLKRIQPFQFSGNN